MSTTGPTKKAKMHYAYRLSVTYPRGVDTNHPPANWVQEIHDGEATQFYWPRVHLYLSKGSAEERAKLLRSYGCTVKIERSQPITWGDPKEIRVSQPRDCVQSPLPMFEDLVS